jgi:hypothetical protein
MKAVAMMTPLPKNLAMTKRRLGIFKAGTRFDRTGKNAPATTSVYILQDTRREGRYRNCL